MLVIKLESKFKINILINMDIILEDKTMRINILSRQIIGRNLLNEQKMGFKITTTALIITSIEIKMRKNIIMLKKIISFLSMLKKNKIILTTNNKSSYIKETYLNLKNINN